jgi:hypothetical protein
MRFTTTADPNLQINLLPWAKLRIHSTHHYALFVEAADNAGAQYRSSDWRYGAAPDDNGNVTIDRLPPTFPGGLALVSSFYRDGDQWTGDQAQVIRLKPGETTTIDPSEGVTLTGRAVPQTSGDGMAGLSGYVQLRALPDGPPSRWPSDWLAAAKVSAANLSYSATVDATGQFHIAGVAPGRYEFTMSMGGWLTPQALAAGLLEVPAGATFTTPDITYARIPKPRVGDAAPPHLGRTLDDLPLKTADFTGKYLLWMVWDNFSTPADRDWPELRSLTQHFAADHRVALIAANADRANNAQGQMEDDESALAHRPQMWRHPGWINAYLSMLDLPLFNPMNYWPPTGPLVFLIAPDGKFAAVALTPEEADAALTRILAAGP